MGFTMLIVGCHFPMWGSMFFGPRESTIAAAGVLTPEVRYCRDSTHPCAQWLTFSHRGLRSQEAYYTREVRWCWPGSRWFALTPACPRRLQYTAEEKEQGLDMPAKLFAANTLTERSRHGSNAALVQLDEKTTATAA